MDPFIGQIMGFGGNFAPRGWAFCDGSLLAISSHSALFSILGTTYGGDGRTTFALPDLRGRVMMGPGNGPGLTPRQIGHKFGAEQVTLQTSEMPNHGHSPRLHVETKVADANNPQNLMLGIAPAATPIYVAPDAAQNRVMAAEAVVEQNVGGSQPHDNIMPSTVIYSIIALVGTYPSRS